MTYQSVGGATTCITPTNQVLHANDSKFPQTGHQGHQLTQAKMECEFTFNKIG